MHSKNKLTFLYWFGSVSVLAMSNRLNRPVKQHIYAVAFALSTGRYRLVYTLQCAMAKENMKIEVFNGQKWKTIHSKFEYRYPIIRIFPLCYCIDTAVCLVAKCNRNTQNKNHIILNPSSLLLMPIQSHNAKFL